MRVFVVMTLACLSACSWFGSRRQELPNPTEIIVTGAPPGSFIFIDGSQTGTAISVGDHPRILNVPAGGHMIEIHFGEKIVYREDTSVSPGEHLVVTVLSGSAG